MNNYTNTQYKKREKTQRLKSITTDSRDTHIYIIPIEKHRWNIDNIFLNHLQLQYT